MKDRNLFAALNPNVVTLKVVFDASEHAVEPTPPNPADYGMGAPWGDGQCSQAYAKACRRYENAMRAFEQRGSRNGQQYTYKAFKSQGIKEGDRLVVPARDSYAIVTVVEVDEGGAQLTDNFDYKWVVGRVDFAAYQATIERETEFNKMLLSIERDKARNQLRADLIERLGEEQATKLLATAAVEKPA